MLTVSIEDDKGLPITLDTLNDWMEVSFTPDFGGGSFFGR